MKPIRAIVMVTLLGASLGAGPVWHEPAEYTGEAIERAIADAYRDIRGRVFLPGGTYVIEKTIVLNGLGPMLIEGASSGSFYPVFNHASSVRLEWHGPKDQPMIRLDTNGLDFRNILLDGRGVASHGVLLMNDPQPGSGMNRFSDMSMTNFTVACFQAAMTEKDTNCADSFFDRVQFFKAPSGFRSMTPQSVNNEFIGCTFGWLECALDIQQGGAVTVVGQGAATCDLLLRVRTGGPYVGCINIDSMKIENSGYKRRTMALVDARAIWEGKTDVMWGCQINIRGLWMGRGADVDAPDDLPPLFQIGPGVQVNLEGGAFRACGNDGRGTFARLEGNGTAHPVLRAPSSIWFGRVDQTTFQLTGPGLIDVSPTDYLGKRSEPLKVDHPG